jgi:hypothetical protein
MAVARSAPHVVLLGDGRALVVGVDATLGQEGVNADSVKVELWDPASGAWHTTESLNKPRERFVAVPLKDGRALVTGGMNQQEQSFSSTYTYDPASGHETWSKAGLLGTARTDATAATLLDGRVLVAGGYYRTKPSYGSVSTPGAVLAAYRSDPLTGAGSSGPRLADVEPPHIGSALATAELFDPATGEWSSTGPLAYARYGADAVTLSDGRILVVGSMGGNNGVTIDGDAELTAEIYDPKTGRFHLAGHMPDVDRAALQAQGAKHANPVPDGDPDTQDVGRLVALDDGGAVLIGQSGDWNHVGDITRSFRFDADAGTWSEIGQTWVSVGEPTAVTLTTPGVRRLTGVSAERLPDGRVLVAGGSGTDEETATASVEIYDPTADTWSPIDPMPKARYGGASVVLADGSILIVGGSNAPFGDSLRSAVRYVPSP